MDTGTSSKMSNSRPERQRGPARKAKKLRRAQLHRQAQGKEVFEVGQQREEATELATGLKGSVASSVHAHVLEQKKNEPAPEGDEQLKAIEDALVKEIPWEMGRWVQMVNDGEPLVLNFDQVPLAISGWSRIPGSLARPQSATAKRQTRWRIRIPKGIPNHV